MDQIIRLANGNPGAITVLMKLIEGGQVVAMLDMLGFTGSSLWVGYKDVCGQDIQKFIEGIQNGDEELLGAMRKQQELEPTPEEIG